MRYGQDAYEDERWPAWRPLVGTIVAVVLLFGSLGASRNHVPTGRAELLGYTFGTILLFYGVLYYVALRRAAVAWRILAFVVVAAAAVLVNMARAGEQIGDIRKEMTSIREDASAMIDGKPLKNTPDAGSPSAVIRTFFTALRADQNEYQAQLEAAGIPNLLSPAALQRDPAILKDCGATDRLRTTLTGYRARMEGRIADMRREIGQMKTSEDVRSGMLEGFDASMARNRPDIDRRLELSGQALVELGTMCRVLARRHWQFRGGTLAFTNGADMKAFNATADRYNAVYSEQTALEQKAEASARASIKAMDPH